MSDLERSVLGAVIVDNRRWPDIEDLNGHLLYPWQGIYSGMRSLVTRGLPIDLVSLKNHLVNTDTLNSCGGISLISGLTDGLPPISPEILNGWVKQIRMASRLRRMAQEAKKLLDATQDPTKTVEELVGQFQAAAFDSDPGNLSGRSYSPIDLRAEASREIDRISRNGGLAGHSYGIPDLDGLTGGLQPGQSIVIGARPSVGKSSLALQIADHVACAGQTVAFFSLEMEAAQLSLIRAKATAQVTSHNIINLRDDHPSIQRLFATINKQAETPLYVEKVHTPTVSAIKARASRIKAEHGLGLIVVDYLQLMTGENKTANRNEELTIISRGLKQMATDLSVPILICAQLNRQAAGSSDKPQLSHLRDSGAIEADADVVILLHRIVPTADRTLPLDVDAIVEKNRTGSCGTVMLTFVGKYQTFVPREGSEL